MLTYKQYKILFGINTLIENNNIISEHSSGCRIIGDKIYECTKYPKYTVDTILKELHEQKYITILLVKILQVFMQSKLNPKEKML